MNAAHSQHPANAVPGVRPARSSMAHFGRHGPDSATPPPCEAPLYPSTRAASYGRTATYQPPTPYFRCIRVRQYGYSAACNRSRNYELELSAYFSRATTKSGTHISARRNSLSGSMAIDCRACSA